MSNFFINIDSRNRSYGSNALFTVTLNDFDLSPGTHVAVSLSEFSMYNLQYPVNSTNNSIIFKEANDDVTEYTATLDEGNYTGAEIATEIALQLNTSTGNAYTYSVAYDSKTGKLTITLTLPEVFKLVSANEIYGYSAGTGFASVTTGNYPLNMSGVEYIDVLIPTLSNSNVTTNDNIYGLIKRIPLEVAWGSLLSYKSMESDDSIEVDAGYLNNLRIDVRNPDASIYDLPENSHISVVLKCKPTY